MQVLASVHPAAVATAAAQSKSLLSTLSTAVSLLPAVKMDSPTLLLATGVSFNHIRAMGNVAAL